MAQNAAMAKLKVHLKAWREETTSLTQEDVAERIDRDVSQVSRIEKGRDVTLGQLTAIAAAIGVKNPLRLLFPPKSPELEMIDLVWDLMGSSSKQKSQALRVVKSLLDPDKDE